MKIIPTDTRIENNEEVAQEDVMFSITPDPIQKTYQTQNEDGTISDVIVNEPQPAIQTNLLVEQQRLGEKQAEVVRAQEALDKANAELEKQQALVDSMTPVITEAIQAQSERIALLPKEEPIEVPAEPLP